MEIKTTVRYHFTPTGMLLFKKWNRKKGKTSDEDMRKLELSHMLVDM